MDNLTIQTKTLNRFRLLGTGDWHVGHATTTTTSIVESLYRMFPDTEETAKLDLILIDGDIYDHDLYLYSEDEAIFRPFRKYLLQLAVKYDIPIRILKGTPDHDWDQAKAFITDNELYEINADVRYVTTVEIEYMERYGIHILYVPDEFMPKCEDTWKVVKDALRRHNLEKVDFCLMHGCFPHQLPNLEGKVQMHNPTNYQNITEYYIVIGHIHQPSQNGKIIGPGSVERLIHGDEGSKGHVLIDIDLVHRNDKITFVKNKYTTPYHTMDMRGLTGDKVIDKIEMSLDKYKMFNNIHLRIYASSTDTATAMFSEITKRYPDVRWKYKSAEDKGKTGQLVTALVDERVSISRPSLTRDNIVDIVTQRIEAKRPEMAAACKLYLQELMNDNH